MSIKNYIKARTQTLNPYHYSGSMFLSRLLWDLKFESWRSRTKVRAWQNRYAGKKAVILCNGPSLLEVDLPLLEGVFTFGLNKIDLLFDKTDFRPSCIVSVNPYVIEQNSDFYNSTEIPLFVDQVGLHSVKSRENVVFLHSTNMPNFARDCTMSVYQGYTVTYVAMQLAFHMGFSKVALVGADHSFKETGPGSQVEIAHGEDKNHFDPNYFSGGMKWQLPDLVGSERSYLLAREVFASDQRSILNATAGGNLNVFERIQLEDFIRTSYN
jgi:hypothetical protein